jgi:shikimate dehydrogenase
MHQSEGKRIGLRYNYELLDFDILGLHEQDLPAVIADAERRGFSGLNVTHPFKQSVIGSLDDLSPEAAAIGAVNTVVLRDGKRIGHNTDSWGFAESIRRDMVDVPLGLVIQIGAGGAGMAVAQALMDLGAARLLIHDIDGERADNLVTDLARRFGAGRAGLIDDLDTAIASADGLVNATPVGMAKYPGTPIPREWLRRDLWVADIVYFPPETVLLATARARGARTLSGVGMAVYQAAMAFELFTGRPADADEMARHLG